MILLGALSAVSALASPGDAVRGSLLASDPRKGNCIICHVIPMKKTRSAAFGNLGPSLAGIGARMTTEILRQRIVDPRVLSPQTIMPAYGVDAGLHRVQSAYVGKPILTPGEIDDVVAFLSTLK